MEEDPFDLLLALADEAEKGEEKEGGSALIGGLDPEQEDHQAFEHPREDSPEPNDFVFGATVKAPKKQPEYLQDGLESFSGLSLMKVTYPLSVLRERLSQLWFARLSQIQSTFRSGPPTSSWATIGVLTDRSKSKESSTGSMFSSWRLSDLQGESTQTLFLFGEAHQNYNAEMAGSVFVVFDGKVRSAKGQMDISVSHEDQLLKLGASKDFAFCVGRRKDGKRCLNPVNKAVCAYCSYHIQAELKNGSSVKGRAQLRGGNLTNAFQRAKLLQVKAKRSSATFTPAFGAQNPASKRSVMLPGQTARTCSQKKVQHVTSVARSQAKRHVQAPSQKMSEIAGPAPEKATKQQSQALQKAVKGEEEVVATSPEEAMVTLEDDGLDAVPDLYDYSGIAAPSSQQKLSNAGKAAAESQRKRKTNQEQGGLEARRCRAAPAKHRECVFDDGIGGMVEVDNGEHDWLNGRAPMPHQAAAGASLAQCLPAQKIAQKLPGHTAKIQEAAEQSLKDSQARLRAADVLKHKLAGKQTAALLPSQRDSAAESCQRQPLKPLQKTAELPPEPGAGFYPSAAGAQARKAGRIYSQALRASRQQAERRSGFAASFGSILEGATAQNSGSRYAGLVEREQDEEMDRMISSLQSKDECQRRAEDVTKLSVHVFHCVTCDRLSERRPTSCSGHEVRRVTTTKRWWTCNGCGDHSSTLGVRRPNVRCRRCPASEFTASSMRLPTKERCSATAKVASKQQLVATAEEAAKQMTEL